MSRVTKWLSFGLISLLAVFMLAACGGKETSGDSKGTGKDTLASIKDRDKIIFGVKTDTRLFGLKTQVPVILKASILISQNSSQKIFWG